MLAAAGRCNVCISSKGHEQAQLVGWQVYQEASCFSMRSLTMAHNIEEQCIDHAGQGRAGQGRAEQGRAGQSRARQGRPGQGRAGQTRARQGRAWRGRAEKGRESKAQNIGLCTAKSSQAGHGIAVQGSAQHNHAHDSFIWTKLHYELR